MHGSSSLRTAEGQILPHLPALSQTCDRRVITAVNKPHAWIHKLVAQDRTGHMEPVSFWQIITQAPFRCLWVGTAMCGNKKSARFICKSS
jgi:hypothetical protein